MPSRNAIKVYAADGIYHLYNRGVEKRLIFLEAQDCSRFNFFLDRAVKGINQQSRVGQPNFTILTACLMPNHFHLLVQQHTERAIETFMRSLMNSYVRYFNRKYDRVGSLFQGPYKAVLVESNAQLLLVHDYIRHNPGRSNMMSGEGSHRRLYETPALRKMTDRHPLLQASD